MKKSNLIKLLLVCLFPSFSSLIAQTEILVRFQDGTHPDTIENIRQEFNATELGISPLSSIRHWQLDSFIYINSEQFFLIGDDTLDIEDVGKKARVKTTIDSGGPNYETFLVSEKQQGDMAPGDITPCNTSLSCPASSQCEVIVSIIDSGVDTDHPYLSPLNWVSSYDFINNTHSQTDEHSHGTHVAGTIAQMVFNAGATNVSMMPLRTQDGTGSGHLFDLILAIDHSILRNANIINISLGYLGPRVDTITKPVPLEYAINLAGQHNVLVVTSAGNHGIDIDTQPYTSFPASFDCSNLITVGSTDCSKDIMSFSNFGDIHVDLGAPGLVYSTVLNEGWEFKVGTSMSSAIVTGLAAVLSTHLCPMQPLVIKDAILYGTENANISSTTRGQVNAGNAKQWLGNFLSRIRQTQPSSTKLSNIQQDIDVFPNPFEGAFDIRWQQQSEGVCYFRLTDAAGRVVDSFEQYFEAGPQQLTKDQSHLPAGIYFLTLKQGNVLMTRKTLKH